MLPPAWKRSFLIARLAVGLICFFLHLDGSHFVLSETVISLGLYCVYAAVALFWRNLEDAGYSVLALAIDTLLFWLTASTQVSYSNWASAIFYAFVLVEAAVFFDWIKIAALVLFSLAVLEISAPIGIIYFAPVLATGASVAVVAALLREYMERRVSASARQAVLYRYDAEKAREAERQRIAADFHDGPLQSLISFQMRLEIIKRLMARDTDAAADELTQLQELCKTQVNELRTFVRSMRPIDVEGSLTATLRRVVEQFERDSGIQASFVSTEFLEPAEPEVSLELLQIVREALYNVQKHATASRVAVSVRKQERTLELAIEDNGQGFPFSGVFTMEELEQLRLGPMSIRRRVRALGGEMLLDSRPGQGAGLKIRLAT